ncbi:MAG: LamG domain-containing protein [Thioalkalispiraceae bacterium]|jgi:mono/diheme cytochrome c family protein
MKHKNQINSKEGVTMRKLIPVLMLAGAFVLSACGGGASNTENTSNNPNNNNNGGGSGGGTQSYTGPAPANEDIQAFRIQFWENVRGDNRCGSCHDVGGQGNKPFADNSNVNDAYVVANTLVNPTDIASSRMVTKFSTGTGHYCWESTQSACAAQLELWIGNWLNDRAGSGGRGIVLSAPQDEDPAPSANFDPTVDPSYYTGNGGLTIHELVSTHCSACHVPTSPQAQAPFFAVSDPQTSYDTVSSVPLINLNTAALSRLYTRLNTDGHHCWDSPNDAVTGVSCAGSAADMLAAINFYTTNGVTPPDTSELDSMLKSRAVTLFEDGITASGGNRFEASQIALYEFKLNGGDTVIDRSGVSPAANLTLFGNPGTDYEWLGSYGIRFKTAQAKAQATPTDSDKLQQLITSTGEYSIEAWVVPGNVAQMDANIVTYGRSATERNFMLGQSLYDYEVYNRNISTMTNADGTPLLTTNPAGEVAQAALQHVVVTYDPTNGRRVYVNGVFRDVGGDPIPGEGLANWATGAALALGNEVDFSRPWNGTIRMLAIHNRALTSDQIRQNFDVGVGQKYYLMFEVGQHLGPECRGPDPDPAVDDPVRDPDYAPLCYIYMEAAQWDNKSFLFAYPRFINLNPSADPTGIQIKHMRIGINGREASNGQGFANMDQTIGVTGTYDPATGQLLSDIGTVVALENGPSGSPPDQLFLTFELLGTATPPSKDYTESFPATPDAVSTTEESAVMIRSFEEINATMAKMTGVDRTIAEIGRDNTIDGGSADTNGTYVKVKQGLPGSSDIQTFVPSQQMAITQLAIEYCNALVEDSSLRASYFPAITFSASSPQYPFTGAERDDVINPLLEHVFNVEGATELTTMPAATTVRNHLYTLMDDLNNSCSGNCSVARSMTIIKSTCAAAVASAPMLLQ